MNEHLTNAIWLNHAQSLRSMFVRIIGRVIGEVRIRDINKKIAYNQVLDINSHEAQQSKDLQEAYEKRWVDIIQGKEFLETETYTTNRQLLPQEDSQQKPQVIQQKIDLSELKDLIVETTKNTIKSEIENTQQQQPNVDVDQIANAIAGKINITQPAAKSGDGVIDESTNVFIDVDEDKMLKSNIEDEGLGTVTTQSAKKAKSKIKKIKSLKSKLK